MSNEALEDISRRLIRLETKVTRVLNGEDDRGVTVVDYSMDFVDDHWELRVFSSNLTIKQIASILASEGIDTGEQVHLFVLGRYVMTVGV